MSPWIVGAVVAWIVSFCLDAALIKWAKGEAYWDECVSALIVFLTAPLVLALIVLITLMNALTHKFVQLLRRLFD